MRTIYQSIYEGTKVRLHDGEQLCGVRVVQGQTEYGHVLFKHSPPVVVIGSNVLIKYCFVERSR